MMNDLIIAIFLTVIFSILICIIEVMFGSKANLKACLNSAVLLYLVIVIVGNTATTLTAPAIIDKLFTYNETSQDVTNIKSSSEDISKSIDQSTEVNSYFEKDKQNLPQWMYPAWFWYAFVGVFGFKVLLQNINITFFDKDVLSINDWINKARDNAVSSAIEVQTNAEFKRSHDLADKLKDLPLEQLNAHVLNALGADRLSEIEKTAESTGADDRLTKSLALAYESYDKASAINI